MPSPHLGIPDLSSVTPILASGIAGMLTGGAGQADSTDVTYASPSYVDECIKKAFPNSYLFPVLA